jgi:hypothetical protein
MESAISIFRKLPETKGQVENYTRLIRESVLNGEVEPLTFAAHISALEKLFTALKSDILIKDVILAEAEKYGTKQFEHGNAKFQIRETGVTYDFAVCGDVEWDQIDSSIKVLQERKKERETFLKSITGEMTIFGEDGAQIMPAIKRSSTQVVITLK